MVGIDLVLVSVNFMVVTVNLILFVALISGSRRFNDKATRRAISLSFWDKVALGIKANGIPSEICDRNPTLKSLLFSRYWAGEADIEESIDSVVSFCKILKIIEEDSEKNE
jgi:hypothetical protein